MRRRYGILFLGFCVSTSLAVGCRLTQPAEDFPAPPIADERPRTSFAAEPVAKVEPPPPVTIPDLVVQRTASAEPPAPLEPLPMPVPTVVAIQTPPDSPAVIALREFLADRPQQARMALRNMEGIDQELLSALMELSAQLSDKGRVDTKETPELKKLKNDLADLLKSRLPLTLGVVRFCSEVKSFGVYRPLAGVPEFQGGMDEQCGEPMRLYIEVKNFKSVPLEGMFATRLAATAMIFNQNDPQRLPLARIEFPARIDRSASPRQDYFFTLSIPVPARLAPGSYTLRLDVRDETQSTRGAFASRVDSRTLDFRVVQRATTVKGP